MTLVTAVFPHHQKVTPISHSHPFRMPGPFDILKMKIPAMSPTQAHSKIHHLVSRLCSLRQPHLLG